MSCHQLSRGTASEGLPVGRDRQRAELLAALERSVKLLRQLDCFFDLRALFGQQRRAVLQDRRERGLRAEADAQRRQRLVRLGLHEGIIREAVIQQRLGRGEAVGRAGAMQHDGDQLQPVALGRG